MITTYRIYLTLEFDTAAKRDTVYNKLKTALASAKITDAWTSGTVQKAEAQRQETVSETV